MDALPTEIEALIYEYKHEFEAFEREHELRTKRVLEAIDKGLTTVGVLPISSDSCMQAVLYTSWLFEKLDNINIQKHRFDFFHEIKSVESKLTMLHLEGMLERAVQTWRHWDPLTSSMH